MKVWLFRLTAVLLVVVCPRAHGAFENLGIRNPVGSTPSTVPQSSISSGLVSAPDPFDTGGNLLMTGNVRRGMHFRGNMPYQSPTSFTSSLGSSALSSFLRDSAGPEDVGTRAAGYGVQPYYSATETVTTTRPGRSEVVSPSGAMTSTRMQQDARSTGAGVFGLDASPAEPMSFTRGAPDADLGLQGPQPRYHLFQESRLEPEGGFPRDVSLSPGDAGRLTSSLRGVRREGEPSGVERLLSRDVQAESGAQFPSGSLDPERRQGSSTTESSVQYHNQRANVENPGTTLQTQMPDAPTTDVRHSVATDFGVSGSTQFPPSTVPTLQDSAGLPKGSNWPDTREELRMGSDKPPSADYGDLAKGEISGARAGSGYTATAEGGSSSQGSFDQGQGDALEQLRQKLDVLTRSVEARLQGARGDTSLTEGTATGATSQATRFGLQPYRSGALDTSRLGATGSSSASSLYNPQSLAPSLGYDRLGRTGGIESDSGLEPPASAGGTDSQDKRSVLDGLGRMSRAEIAAEARRIMGPHTSPESFSDAKFNEHIRAAEEHLRAGRYYQAADSFSLAAVYKPDHLVVLAGKSHALFAAGEYVSSALFLSRALAAFPEYVRVDVDLAALLGGQDKIARRLADIEQWYARSGSGQLQFLLSYVYYRTGRFSEAKRAVETAYQKMPELPAVRTMKTAIDGAAR